MSTGSILNTLSMLDPSFVKVVNNEMGSDPNTIPSFEIRGSSSLKSTFEGNPNMPTFIMDVLRFLHKKCLIWIRLVFVL